MSSIVRMWKQLIMGTLLVLVGFMAGWFSSALLGDPLVMSGDLAALIGPGRSANSTTPAELRQQFKPFWEVWNLVENEYYQRSEIDRQRMIQGAIRGMLAVLGDQYTVYQEPNLAAQTTDHMRGTMEGIGAYIRISDGKAYIERTFKESPAVQAGLKKDDQIVTIDGLPVASLVAGLDIHEAAVKVASKLRGPEGSTVKLTIGRGEQRFDIAIVRAKITIASVQSQMLDGGVAYIQITEFKANTAKELDTALSELIPQKPRSIILDLRNNPGGFLTSAQEVLGRFYTGVALYEEDGTGNLHQLNTIAGSGNPRLDDIQLVVLVNSNSASASEIVAGALRDLHPSTYLLGEKTYGKGSVQNIHMLSDGGSARITVAHWLTPSKTAINGIGITPEYVVPYAEDSSSPVPCVADRQPLPNQTSCTDTQLAWALKLLITGQKPPSAAATTK